MKFLNKFLNRNVTMKEAQEQTQKEDFDMRDFLVPLQHLVNTITQISEEKSTDVYKWSMKDLYTFMAAVQRFEHVGGNKHE